MILSLSDVLGEWRSVSSDSSLFSFVLGAPYESLLAPRSLDVDTNKPPRTFLLPEIQNITSLSHRLLQLTPGHISVRGRCEDYLLCHITVMRNISETILIVEIDAVIRILESYETLFTSGSTFSYISCAHHITETDAVSTITFVLCHQMIYI